LPMILMRMDAPQAYGHPGWLEEDLEEVLQVEPDLPLRSKASSRTIVRVTTAINRACETLQPRS